MVRLQVGVAQTDAAITTVEQGAAPDRLQLRSFLTPLPAAGELGRSAAARGFDVN